MLHLEHIQGFTHFPLAPLTSVCVGVYKCWHFYNYSIRWNPRCCLIFTAEPVASPDCVNCAPKDSAPTAKRIQWQKSPLASQPQSLGSLLCFWVGQIHCHFSRSVLIWAVCQLQCEVTCSSGMHEEINSDNDKRPPLMHTSLHNTRAYTYRTLTYFSPVKSLLVMRVRLFPFSSLQRDKDNHIVSFTINL